MLVKRNNDEERERLREGGGWGGGGGNEHTVGLRFVSQMTISSSLLK